MDLLRYGRPYATPLGLDATHGIRASYSRGCRCDLCREAWRVVRGEKERTRRRARKLEEARALLREAGELS